MTVQQSSPNAAEFNPVRRAAAGSCSGAASGAARRFILSSSSLSPGRTRSLTACNLNFGKNGDSLHSVQRFSSFTPPAAPRLIRRVRRSGPTFDCCRSETFFFLSFLLPYSLPFISLRFYMASVWQSVLAAHRRIVDNGGMLMIAHTYTELSSNFNFKNLRLRQIFSGCRTNVCVCARLEGRVGCRCFPWRASTMAALWLVF